MRWEFKHPTPFLRTREFLWQEGFLYTPTPTPNPNPNPNPNSNPHPHPNYP